MLPRGTEARVVGTAWLKFWNYVGLPAVCAIGFLATLDLPRFRYEVVPIAILAVAVAVGLHRRKLWGWQLNWLVIAVIYLAFLVPIPIRDPFASLVGIVTHGGIQLRSIDWTRDSLGDLALPVAIRLVFVSFVWLWPNWIYWKRREKLFS
jgi:hypothetical protein